jgi:DNA modification methylase
MKTSLGNPTVIGQPFLSAFLAALRDQKPVAGFTHNFYRYPARFSPVFARAAIEAFSQPGELVLDPFMGGGTTLVEARLLGRRGIGIDVSELSVFIAKVKSTPLSKAKLEEVASWVEEIQSDLTIRSKAPDTNRQEDAYKRNLEGNTWRIRKVIEIALGQLAMLKTSEQKSFARCAVLKTAQWALDCKKEIPSVAAFRSRFKQNFNQMREAAQLFSSVAREADRQSGKSQFRTIALKRSAIGLEQERNITQAGPPKLILTSPPYPGVHVLYHRWQIQGRRETPAPFWIANCLDGSGSSYYTMGDRKQRGLKDYYDGIRESYKSLSRISDENTVVVQLVAFSEPSWQLPKYLKAMLEAGFSESMLNGHKGSNDSRLWRDVPNRKWYAQQKGATPSSREVILIHKLNKA